MMSPSPASPITGAGDKGGVIVIGPPWLRTGTGRVIEDQIAFYRDRGYTAAYVAVAVDASHGRENPMWIEIAGSAMDLATPHVFFAVLDRPPNPHTIRNRLLHTCRGLTSLDWIAQIGRRAVPPVELLAFARELPISLIHVNHVFTLGFARRLRACLGKALNGIPAILETHDVQAHILHQRDEPNPWTGRPDPIERLECAEIALLRDQNVLVHCSVDDQTYFLRALPGRPHVIARPTIDPAFVAAVKNRCAEPKLPPIDVLFVGTGHDANREAITWLLTEVWPHVEDNGWQLKIVGGIEGMMRYTSPALHARFRGCFTGHVADLAPYYRAARCVVAPMRSGGGTSIKTIEAFALGLPFVGTTKAYRGFPTDSLDRAGIHPFDSPRDFADAIARAIAGEDDSAARGQAMYKTLFSKEACHVARDEAVRLALLAGKASEPKKAN